MRRLVAFVFCGVLMSSITVRAESGASVVDQPKNCFKALSEGAFCAVYAPSKVKIPLGENVLFVRSQTSLLFYGRDRVEILAGEVLLQKNGYRSLEVKIFREVLTVESGEILLSRKDQQSPVDLVNLRAQVGFSGQWSDKQVLPPGYQNWFAPGMKDPGLGVPRIYDSEVVFRKVTDLWNAPTKEVVEVLKSFGELRRSAHAAAADSYQGLVQRHFASVEEDRRQEERRLKALKAEKEELRRLYRARVLEGEYTQPFD